MKRSNLWKYTAIIVFAMMLVSSFSISAQAAKIGEKEIEIMGNQGNVSISLDYAKQTGPVTKTWVIKPSVVPEDAQVLVNVYEGTRENSETGYWMKNEKGELEFHSSRGGLFNKVDKKIHLENYMFKMGKKTVEVYIYDVAAQKKAIVDARNAYNEYYKLAEQQAGEAYDKAVEEWSRNQSLQGTEKTPYPKWNDYYGGILSEQDYYKQYNIDLSNAAYTKKATNDFQFEVKKIAHVQTAIKSTSIELRMADDAVTGFEIYRKVGGKYKKIAKIAKNVYVDKGLISKTKYSYKVRPYYYNEKTGKTSYGLSRQLDATTIGSPLNLKIKVSGKKNVKLTWKKVPNAIRYEIYRRIDYSDTTTIQKGDHDAYAPCELIKTLGKNAKTYTDKKTNKEYGYVYSVVAVLSGNKKVTVEQSGGVSLTFKEPSVLHNYVNAKGAKTIEWSPVSDADGYIIKKEVRTYNPQKYGFDVDYKEIARQGKTKTKRTFAAPVPVEKSYVDGNGNTVKYWENQDVYHIYSYKNGGKIISENALVVTVDSKLGTISKVSVKKLKQGIQVSWSPVPGASYYNVYRVKAGALIKNKDNGCYESNQGQLVYEYVGAQDPVKVDVAAWNAERDAYQKDNTLPKPSFVLVKLDPEKTYYYRNYQYKQHNIIGTSMIDYAGDIYGWESSIDSYYSQRYSGEEDNGKKASRVIEFNPDYNYRVGPKEGVTYQYYVVAVLAEEKTEEDYVSNDWEGTAKNQYEAATKLYGVKPGTTIIEEIGTKPVWKKIKCFRNDWWLHLSEHDYIADSIGCKKIGTATYTSMKTPKKTSIKSLKAGKKSVKVTIKKVSGTKSYRIYRATKKKGPYQYAGSTTKTQFTDKGLKSGKKYYYRVVTVRENEAKADLVSPPSKVKSVTAK